MDDSAILVLVFTAFILALCWEPTRLLIAWSVGLLLIIGIAMALGPMWFIALLLFLLLLK